MKSKRVPGSVLAHWIGLTARRLNQLVTDGVLERGDEGFDIEASVRRYCDFLRKDEETKRERRALLRAQTSATNAKAARHLGTTYTYDDIQTRLREIEHKLWALRVVPVWQQERLRVLLGDEPARVEYCIAHQELSHSIAKLRDDVFAAFPAPVAVQSENDDAP
jgi:hypothetical protein